jgi:hypothetical protein
MGMQKNERRVQLSHRDDVVLCHVYPQTSVGWCCEVSDRADESDHTVAENADGVGETAEEAVAAFRRNAAKRATKYMHGER